MIVRDRCPDCPLPKDYRCCPENEIPPRGEYEWDQSDDPWMINKTVRCPIPGMSGLFCLASHVDGWGHVHQCERNVGHTGRHFSCNWKHDYIVAVWK